MQDVIGGDVSRSCDGKEKQQVETVEASLFTVSLKQLLLHQQAALTAFGSLLLQTGERKKVRKEKKWPAAKQLWRTC